MGRVVARSGRVQVSSRLTWTFSARATLGHAHRPRPHACTALLRALLRAAACHRRRRRPGHRAGGP
ncbi:hypothetical protein ACGF5O_31315 [Streptomyces sp. NPDC048291]|uniref:hypothetical protein n=1 Tax=Streptomyces sp. NPDC048291 TaxID=3365530 RepID=UPI00371796BE